MSLRQTLPPALPFGVTGKVTLPRYGLRRLQEPCAAFGRGVKSLKLPKLPADCSGSQGAVGFRLGFTLFRRVGPLSRELTPRRLASACAIRALHVPFYTGRQIWAGSGTAFYNAHHDL